MKLTHYLTLLILLTCSCINSTRNSKVNEYEDFNDFFIKFSADSIYQKSRVIFPLKYTYDDIDKGLVTEKLDKDKWFYINFSDDKFAKDNDVDAFEIKVEKINNTERKYSRQGIDNGILVEFYFKNIDNHWFLSSVSDLSN